jgi:hypothetical protein
VCYDCHGYVHYSVWNPYGFSCPRFTLWITNDPYYYTPSYWYPWRYYGGWRTVFTAPAERGGRYVFKAREDQSAPAIAYRDRSREDPADRRPAERGVRGADIGGVGTVPYPGGRRTASPGGATVVSGATRLAPEPRIPLVPGEAKTPGRREAQPPAVRTGVTPVSTPRGVFIDPTAGAKAPQPRSAEPADPRAVPEGERGRRAEPVYIARPAGERSQEQPSAEPSYRRPESRPEPREAPPPERRAAPRNDRPSSAPSARPSARPSSPPPSRPSAPAQASPRRRPG